jgi:hypothetical protein
MSSINDLLSFILKGVGALNDELFQFVGGAFVEAEEEGSLSVISTEDGEIVVNTEGTLVESLTIDSGVHAGTYTNIDISGIESAPVVVSPMTVVIDSPEIGDTLDITGGLALFFNDGSEPTFSYELVEVGGGESVTGLSLPITIPANFQGVDTNLIERITDPDVGETTTTINLGTIGPVAAFAYFDDGVTGYTDGQDLIASGDYVAYGVNNDTGAGVFVTSDHTAGGLRINHNTNTRLIATYPVGFTPPVNQIIRVKLDSFVTSRSSPYAKAFSLYGRATFAGMNQDVTGYRMLQSAFSGDIFLQRMDNNAATTLDTASSQPQLPLNGEFRLTINGTGASVTLTGSVYDPVTELWTDVVSAVDTSADRITTAGNVAVGTYMQGFESSNQSIIVTNFSVAEV